MISLASLSRPAFLTIPLLAIPLLATALLWPGLVQAQDTTLRLAESATVLVAPDELIAALRVEAIAPTAQEAQKKVNEAMRDAIAAAKKVEGAAVSNGGYNVWRLGPTPQDRAERWQAGENLTLTGKDGEALLKLAGELQQKGLTVASLGWHLSREAERKARKDATRQALSALRGRAEEAAELLNLRFDSFREVRLDSLSQQPIGMPRSVTMTRANGAAAPAVPPPSAAAEDLPVTASAEADAILKPR